MGQKKIYGVIPARYASTRFPGKPLAKILNKPMFVHVYERAKRCDKIHEVVLATDHKKIFETAREYNVPVIMTDTSHKSGTDRVYEAVSKLGITEHDIVINIQGDEPLLDPIMLDELIQSFDDNRVEVATLAREISFEEAVNPNVVKVVLDSHGFAMYFSRAPIPYCSELVKGVKFLGHIGMYGYRFNALKRFVSLPQSQLEKIEKLEQLRLLQNQIPIHVKITKCFCLGVDTPEDLAKVEKILTKGRCECGHCWH